MNHFEIPNIESLAHPQKEMLEGIQKNLGFVPNIFAYYAKHKSALGDMLSLEDRASNLSCRERAAVRLLVSQHNECDYGVSAQTMMAMLNDFSAEAVYEIRKAGYSADSKLDALLKYTKLILDKNGHLGTAERKLLFDAGYSEMHLIDLTILIGTEMMRNYLESLVSFEMDYPLGDEIRRQTDI